MDEIALEEGKGGVEEISEATVERATEILFAGINHNLPNVVLGAIADGADINKVNIFESNDTPLISAIKLGHTEIAKILIQKHADVNQGNLYDNTPLIIAAQYNNVETAQILIANNAHIEAKNDNGHTALIEAIISHSKDMVDFLISQHADLNAIDNHCLTALMHAIHEENIDLAEILISQGAEVSLKNQYGKDALDVAILTHFCDKNTQLRIVRKIITHIRI